MAMAVKQRTRPLESLKHQQVLLPVFGPRLELKVGHTYIVHGGKNGGRFRKDWRQIEFAQASLHELHPAGVPRGISHRDLTRDVNELLDTNPDFHNDQFGDVHIRTVRRARELVSKSS